MNLCGDARWRRRAGWLWRTGWFSREFVRAVSRRERAWQDRVGDLLESVRVFRLLGLALLLAALGLRWFAVPAPGGGRPVEFAAPVLDSAATMPAKAGLVVALVLVVFGGRHVRLPHRRWPRVCPARVAAAACGGVLILYPAWLVQRDVRVSAQAAQLQMQHDNLIWLGGDVWTAREYALDPAKTALDVKDPPRRFCALPSPPVGATDFGPARLGELLMWLGYTPGFCQFVAPGWLLAVLGTGCLALGYSDVVRGAPAGARGTRVLAVWGVVLALGLVLALGCAWRAGRALALAKSAVREGRAVAALAALAEAERAVPVLGWHTDWICQKGRLQLEVGRRDTPEAAIAQAVALELEGAGGRAAARYAALLDTESPAVRAEAMRGVLRLACIDFNAGRMELAAATLADLTGRDATQLKAWYTLALTDLARGRRANLRECADRIDAVYRRFRAREKIAVQSFAQHHLAEAAAEAGDVKEMEARLRRVLKP